MRKNSRLVILLLSLFASVFANAQLVYNFTNAGASGRTGPTQAQVNAAYFNTSLNGLVTINTQGVQEWIVPATGLYKIETSGAEGGYVKNNLATPAGRGVKIVADVFLTAGTRLYIIVGQRGGSSGVEFSGGGYEAAGGGGSFVAKGTSLATSTPVMVAGGGAGATYPCCGAGAGRDAETTTAGVSGNLGGAGGVNGSGGANGSAGGAYYSSGGGGFYGNGQDGMGGFGGTAFISGGTGGIGGNNNLNYTNSNDRIDGGFGSGGSARGNAYCGGGGGGGYSGGGAGGSNGPRQGGGGGSFLDPSATKVSTSNGLYNGTANLNGTIVNLNSWNQGNGSVTITAYPAGALNFDGVNDYVNIPNPFTAYNKELTVEWSVNINPTTQTTGVGIGQSLEGLDDPFDHVPSMVWLMHHYNGTFQFYVSDNGVWKSAQATVSSGWHRFVGVASASSIKIYMDGNLIQTTTPGVSNSILNVPGSVIQFGKDVRYNSGRFMNGSIDEVRIWSRALCQGEIQNNNSCELSGTQTALQGYYKFNQGYINQNNSTETALPDLSGNNRNGTLMNFALNGSTSNWVAGNITGSCATFIPPSSTISASGPTTFCQGGSVTLTANAGSAYLWSNGATTQSILVSQAGSYSVTVLNANGCSGTSAPVSVTVNPLPTATITASGPTTFCQGGSVTLNANTGAGLTYQWKLNGNNIGGATSSTYNTTAAGNYSVVVTNSNNCAATSASIAVAVNTLPVATITTSGSTTFCQGGSVTLTASNGSSYLWSNNATTQSINVTDAGNYSVVVTNANACSATSAPTTVSYTMGVDTDGDGIPDACDLDDDNDGIPDSAECNKSNFYWSNAPTESGNTATGVINGINYTYTSSQQVLTSPEMYSLATFPASYAIPSIKCIRNIFATNNTLTFSSPISNPVLVFASIGQGGVRVPIVFSSPVDILWSTNVTRDSARGITGEEGYAIVRLNGTFSSISFDYKATENWVNFLFGADFQTCGDTDADGIPDYLDMDSDNDGCIDAIEGNQNPSLTQTLNGRLTGGVDANGIPLIVNGGQGIGTSQNANVNCHCQPGIDQEIPVIDCPDNITINATSAAGAIVNYTIPTATDNCATTITRVSGLASGSNFPIGTSTVTYSAIDGAGNSSQCSFTVTVTCVAPAITNCPQTQYQQIYSDANTCSAVFSYNPTIAGTNPTVTYTLTGATSGSGNGTGSGSAFNVGQTTVKITVTNNCGTASCTFVVTVIDNVLPVALAKNITVYLNASGTASIIPQDINNGSNDNCGPVTLSFNSGIVCGQAAENQNVIVTAPAGEVITGIDFASYGTPNGTCGNFTIGGCNSGTSVTRVSQYLLGQNSATIPATNGVFGDPCGGTVKRLYVQAHYGAATANTYTFNCSNLGNNSVKLLVTDANGNVSTANATVTVLDTTKPVISCPAPVTVSCSSAVPAHNINTVTVSDNCSAVVTWANDVVSNQTSPDRYTITRTYVAADPSGNSVSCSQVITVNDNVAPAFSNVPAPNVTVNCDAVPAPANVTATDNCNGSVPVNYFQVPSVSVNTLHHWPADGNMNDVAGSANGTAVGTVAYGPGILGGNAFQFTGTSHINVGTAGSLSGTGDFAVSAWIKTSSTSPGVIIQQRDGNIDGQYILKIGGNHNNSIIQTGKVYFLVNGQASGVLDLFSTISVNDGKWHHVMGERKGTTVNIYIDGALNATGTLAVVVNMNAAIGTYIGYDVRDGSSHFNGSIDYVKVHGPSACPQAYERDRYWTASDASLNQSVVTQTLHIVDVTPPVVTCPSNISINNTPGQCGTNVNFAATATDNCGAVTITYDRQPGSFFPVGPTVVHVTARDQCGNQSLCNFTVTVTDNQKPVITTSGNKNVFALPGLCSANPIVSASANDNCSVGAPTGVRSDGQALNAPYPVGTTTITWNVTDVNGVAALPVTQTVTVTDNQPPVISCAPAVIVNSEPGICGAAITFCSGGGTTLYASNGGASVGASDGGAIMTVNPTTAASTVLGIPVNGEGITGIAFASDGTLYGFLQNGVLVRINALNGTLAGTIGQVTVNSNPVQLVDMAIQPGTNKIYGVTTGNTLVVVNSTTAVATVIGQPVGSGSFLSIAFNSSGTLYGVRTNQASHLLTINPANGAIINTTVMSPLLGAVGLGVHPTSGILYASECCGATPGVGNTLYTIDPTSGVTSIVGSMGGNRRVQDLAFGGGCAYQKPTATDNCSGAITITGTRSDGRPLSDVYPVGTTTLTWTATDVANNFSTCTQTVTVNDKEQPKLIGVPVNTTVECTQVPSPAVVTATDNCPGVGEVQFMETVINGNCPGNKTVTRTWSVTDAHNNTTSATQTITVEDTQAPVINTQASNRTVECDGQGNAAQLQAWLDNHGGAAATDACSGVTWTNNFTALSDDCGNTGSANVIFTATDNCGNASSTTATFTIVDTTPPSITAASNSTVECDGQGNAAELNAWLANHGGATASDVCSGVTWTNNFTSLSDDCGQTGAATVTFTATDACGNVSAKTATFTIVDTTPPSITAASNSTVECDGQGNAAELNAWLANHGGATASDVCSGVTWTNNFTSLSDDCGQTGAATVTFTATDACGNTSTTTARFAIEDHTAPVITCPASVTLNCEDNSAPSATGSAMATDICSGATISFNDVSTQNSSINDRGHYNYTITRTWKAVDDCGNATTCTQVITVQDITPPTALCKPLTITLVNGAASIMADAVNNGSSDICSPVTLTVSPSTFNCGNIGANTVTLTVKDVTGNTNTCQAVVTVVGEIPTCNITSVPTNTTYTGGVPTNLFLGYGAQSTTLQLAVPASGAPYTFSWTGNGTLSSTTVQSPLFAPTAAGTYTFKVFITNRYGCTTTCTISICVTDIRVMSSNGTWDGKKVYVCHVPPGNPGNSNTLEISVNAVPAHIGPLGHATDRLGRCEVPACGAAFYARGTLPPPATEKIASIMAYPNPTTGVFELLLQNYNKGKVEIQVIDNYGKLVAKQIVNVMNPSENVMMDVTRHASGVYHVRVVSEDGVKTLRVVVAR